MFRKLEKNCAWLVCAKGQALLNLVSLNWMVEAHSHMVRIRIVDGLTAGQETALSPGVHIVGRAAGSDWVLAADSISGKHLQLTVSEEGSVRFQDIGSTNGTWSGGVKVQEGEWFPGTELRLGACRLQLLEEEGQEESASHSQGREEALQAKKSGPWALVVLLLFLGASGAWAIQSGVFSSSVDLPETATQVSTPSGLPSLDAIDDLGHFGSAGATEAWTLAEGWAQEGSRLVNRKGRGKASLAARFPVQGGLELSADVQGAEVVAVIAWGTQDAERPTVEWRTAPLSSSPVLLAFPKEADWFTLSLSFSGAGSCGSLQVHSVDEWVDSQDMDGRTAYISGGNLFLRYRDGRSLLEIAGEGGHWSTTSGGLNYQGPGRLSLTAGEAAQEAGPFLILSEGGPRVLTPGLRVDASPGCFVGGEARRFLFRFAEPSAVMALSRAAIMDLSSAQLRWDLTDALAQSARLDRRVKSAVRAGNAPEILAASAELVRDWPLDETKVDYAQGEIFKILQEGRQELRRIQGEKEDALFLGSRQDLRSLQAAAEMLSERFSATTLREEAILEAQDLARTLVLLEQDSVKAEADYQLRLSRALKRAYPILSTWLQREGRNE